MNRQKTLGVKLFYTALKYENEGRYEAAIAGYEQALSEAKKRRHSKDQQNKIVDKIMLLQTVMQYENNFNLR